MQQRNHKKRSRNPFRNLGIGKDKEYFVQNLGMLVSSGMGIVSAMDALKEEMDSSRMKQILQELQEDISAGVPLWKALEVQRIFPPHMVSLVRIGEESGRLSENLHVIAMEEQKDREFRAKLKSAMIYPAFVATLTIIIGVGIAWFILPRLATVFAQLSVELPFITRVLIQTGQFLQEYGLIAVPLAILFILFLMFLLFGFQKTKFLGHCILFRIPGINRLIREIELARFGYLLGTLLQAGVGITTALDSLAKAASFDSYKKFYLYLRDSIEDGNSFQQSFISYKKSKNIVTPSVQQMVVAGEKSGNLSNVLMQIGKSYETKTDITTKNLAVVLEPVMLVIVWFGVVGVALAVILPIYSLIGGLDTQPASSTSTPTSSTTIPAPPISEQEESVFPDSDNDTTENQERRELFQEPPVNEGELVELPMLRILSSETGVVNVRTAPAGEIIASVFPGEEYRFQRINDVWYEIVLDNGEVGWVHEDYIEIFEEISA